MRRDERDWQSVKSPEPIDKTLPGAARREQERNPEADVCAHRFKAIVFDWDGTAVANRQEDATPLVRLCEQLLRCGTWLVVVTGTNFGNIERQFAQYVVPTLRNHLVICANRGSEVYGFAPDGTATRRWIRVATPEEEHALTAIAEAMRDRLTSQSTLQIAIVYDRLNRRKIDLIPLPEWRDPPKAQIGALLEAVQQRLATAGIPDGIHMVIQLTEQLAREMGVNVRITSDVKHIEIGLTDKGDAIAWIKRNLLATEQITLSDVLIAGDEFGAIAGFAGSDDRLRTDVDGALVVSVGAEPSGVPPGVCQLGGGPARFRSVLAQQIELCRREQDDAVTPLDTNDWFEHAIRPLDDATWQLEAVGYVPELEHEIETLYAVSNGYLGIRASLETPTTASRPRTFVAGLFDGPRDLPGVSDVPELVAAPDWLRLGVQVDDQLLDFNTGNLLGHRRLLDMRRGLLLHEWRLRASSGCTVTIRSLRCAHLTQRTLGMQVAHIDVDQPAHLCIGTWSEPTDSRLTLARRGDYSEQREQREQVSLWHTARSGHALALAQISAIEVNGQALDTLHIPCASTDGPTPRHHWHWHAAPGQQATLVRIITLRHEADDSESVLAAEEALHVAQASPPAVLLGDHARAWARRWDASDIEVRGDDDLQQRLRFALYHLNSAANPEDERISIGARALTGDAYRGHVFWDTDIFLLPFYVYTWPEAARTLLMYRFHTLPAARAKAASLGYRGALYPWESADSGEDVTPTRMLQPDGQIVQVKCGRDEQHISADVAYAVWLYWTVSQDTNFFVSAGAEMLLETARFWASRVVENGDQQFHIRHVIGPDEYHDDVDDNAYTNSMAQWNLIHGHEAARLLADQWPAQWDVLATRLGITSAECRRWQEIAARLATGFDARTQLYQQFAGYFALEQLDLSAYNQRTAALDVVLGSARVKQTQAIKQADVVMLLALLWEQIPAAVREANFRYFEPRCAHGSSLSPALHALVAARLGDVGLAERYLRQALAIDLGNTMGNAAQGIHIGAFGGAWQAVVLGFVGMSVCADGLRFDPHLPARWERLRCPVQWQRRHIRVLVTQHPLSLTVTVERGDPLTIHVGHISQTMGSGTVWTCIWHEQEQCWKEGRL